VTGGETSSVRAVEIANANQVTGNAKLLLSTSATGFHVTKTDELQAGLSMPDLLFPIHRRMPYCQDTRNRYRAAMMSL